jgi:hypothetical protein
VSDHLIRLRGGWEAIDLDSDDPRPRRITLPGDLARGRKGRVRLVRRFGRPRLGGPDETLSLRMERVPGLITAVFNGNRLPLELLANDPIEFRPVPLRDRNELVLDVDTVAAGDQAGAKPAPWGEIALVITRVTSTGSGSWRDSCDRVG